MVALAVALACAAVAAAKHFRFVRPAMTSGRLAAAAGCAVCAGLVLVWVLWAGRLDRPAAGFVKAAGDLVNPRRYNPEAVELIGNTIYVRAGGNSCLVARDAGGNWVFRDAGSGRRALAMESEAASAGGGTSFRIPERPSYGLSVKADGRQFTLSLNDIAVEGALSGGTLYLRDELGNWRNEIPPAKRFLFAGFEGLCGHRGYIWRYGIGLAAGNPFFGGGPDTFGVLFPNWELALHKRYFPQDHIDKGHSIFVNNIANLGILGFLAWLAPVAFALRKVWSRGGRLAPALLACMTAYAVAGLATDSTVGVTPLFFAVCGLATASESLLLNSRIVVSDKEKSAGRRIFSP